MWENTGGKRERTRRRERGKCLCQRDRERIFPEFWEKTLFTAGRFRVVCGEMVRFLGVFVIMPKTMGEW